MLFDARLGGEASGRRRVAGAAYVDDDGLAAAGHIWVFLLDPSIMLLM